MRFKNLYIFALLVIIGCGGFGQAQVVADSDSENPNETIIIDEFGRAGECELNARVQNIFATYLEKIPNSKAYIIIYRDAQGLPSNQSENALQMQIQKIRREVKFLRYDESKLVLIDGGFRDGSTIQNEVWLVPEGGQIPVPTRTVAKPETPKDKAYKVSVNSVDENIGEARLDKPDYSEEAVDYSDEEMPEIEEEIPEAVEIENEYYQPYWISDFFFNGLNQDKSLKGVIIFYLDVEEYDLGKVNQIMNEDLKEYARQTNQITDQAKIIFGGYSRQERIEYWFVPRGAKEPIPTPEIKEREEPEQ